MLLGDSFEPNQAYYLFEASVDWYRGLCRVLVGMRKKSQAPREFHEALFKKLRSVKNLPPKGLDGAIAAASDNYLVYWEHWMDSDPVNNKKSNELAKLVEQVLLKDAMPIKVPVRSDVNYEGLEIKGGECMNLRFPRRQLFPF